MKILKKLALAAVMLTAAVSAKAEWVSGYNRSNGTYVNGYYRTPANGTLYDNLSYRSSYAPRYSGRSSYSSGGYGSTCSGYSSPVSVYGTSTQIGGTTFHNYSSSAGGRFYGNTTTIGNRSFTTLNRW